MLALNTKKHTGVGKMRGIGVVYQETPHGRGEDRSCHISCGVETHGRGEDLLIRAKSEKHPGVGD